MVQQQQRRTTLIGTGIYLTISLVAALAFALVATALGKYTNVAIYGGAAWVFLLTMIVTMPIVIPRVRARMKA